MQGTLLGIKDIAKKKKMKICAFMELTFLVKSVVLFWSSQQTYVL